MVLPNQPILLIEPHRNHAGIWANKVFAMTILKPLFDECRSSIRIGRRGFIRWRKMKWLPKSIEAVVRAETFYGRDCNDYNVVRDQLSVLNRQGETGMTKGNRESKKPKKKRKSKPIACCTEPEGLQRRVGKP